MPAKKAPVRESAHLANLKAAIVCEQLARETAHRAAREHTERLLDEVQDENFPAVAPIAIRAP